MGLWGDFSILDPRSSSPFPWVQDDFARGCAILQQPMGF